MINTAYISFQEFQTIDNKIFLEASPISMLKPVVANNSKSRPS